MVICYYCLNLFNAFFPFQILKIVMKRWETAVFTKNKKRIGGIFAICNYVCVYENFKFFNDSKINFVYFDVI